MEINGRFPRGIERLFFGGKSTNRSTYVAFGVGNIVLMLVLFCLVLNTFVNDWTGHLYPEGSGANLAFLSGSLDNVIPFMPE